MVVMVLGSKEGEEELMREKEKKTEMKEGGVREASELVT